MVLAPLAPFRQPNVPIPPAPHPLVDRDTLPAEWNWANSRFNQMASSPIVNRLLRVAQQCHMLVPPWEELIVLSHDFLMLGFILMAIQ